MWVGGSSGNLREGEVQGSWGDLELGVHLVRCDNKGYPGVGVGGAGRGWKGQEWSVCVGGGGWAPPWTAAGVQVGAWEF